MKKTIQLSSALVACVALACGGGIAPEAPVKESSADPQPSASPSASASATTAPTSGTAKPDEGPACPSPAPVIVASGGTIARPTGSALRLTLIYQGASIGVSAVRGVDMIIGRSDGPFTPGKVSGYWVETRTGAKVLYQQLFRDPTVREAPPSPDGGGFSNSTVDRCEPKMILADVPNDPAATEVRIYGSPYGTNNGAIELARFNLK